MGGFGCFGGVGLVWVAALLCSVNLFAVTSPLQPLQVKLGYCVVVLRTLYMGLCSDDPVKKELLCQPWRNAPRCSSNVLEGFRLKHKFRQAFEKVLLIR